MSYKDLSPGTGKKPEPSTQFPSGEGENGIFGEDPVKPAPWESLRPAEPKPEEPKPPSRIGIFLRKALRWTTGLVFVFGLGIVTAWFVRVQPQDAQIDDLNDRIQAAEITVGELEGQILALVPLGEKNENLLVEISKTQLHVDVMKVLVDVNLAELAVAKGDLVTAKASLTGTDARLAVLQEELQGDDQQTIEGMRIRLTLVLDEIEEDTTAAMSDLDVLSSNLVALERSLFGN